MSRMGLCEIFTWTEKLGLSPMDGDTFLTRFMYYMRNWLFGGRVEPMADLITPTAVADFLLCESRERGDLLTNLKLQKLIYYSQAWYLATKDRSLFEEDFEAWVHGPVLRSQYFRFRDFTWKPITTEIEMPMVTAPIVGHLNEVVDVFGSETAVALELMTHREKPWIDARGAISMDTPSNAIITKASMKEYYRSIADQKD
jgi:uncharacterized phage-associated protein